MPKERRPRVKFLNHKNVTRAYIESGGNQPNPTHQPPILPPTCTCSLHIAWWLAIKIARWWYNYFFNPHQIMPPIVVVAAGLVYIYIYIYLMWPINPHTLICVLIAFSTWQCNDALSHSPLQVVVATCCRALHRKIHTQSAQGICPISRSNNWNSYDLPSTQGRLTVNEFGLP